MFRIDQRSQQAMAQAHAGRLLAHELGRLAKRAHYDATQGEVFVEGHQGQRATLRLDERGQLIEAQSPLGRTTRFGYENDKLVSVGAPSGLTTTFHYDDAGRVSSIAPSTGMAQQLAYDEAGNLARYRAGSAEVALSWTPERRLSRVSDRAGHVTRREYDEAGSLIAIDDAAGRSTSMRYGIWEQPILIERPDLSRETFDFSARGFTHALDGQKQGTFSFSEEGRLLSAQYDDGYRLTLDHDAQGRICAGHTADSSVVIEYDAQGRVVAEHQPSGSVRFRYTADHQLEALQLPDGSGVTFAYDADGRCVALRDWNGEVQRFAYDAADVPKARSLPNGLVEHYERDAAGALLATATMRTAIGTVRWARRTTCAIGPCASAPCSIPTASVATASKTPRQQASDVTRFAAPTC